MLACVAVDDDPLVLSHAGSAALCHVPFGDLEQ